MQFTRKQTKYTFHHIKIRGMLTAEATDFCFCAKKYTKVSKYHENEIDVAVYAFS